MTLLELLRSDGSIIINKKLAHALGIDAAIMYSELISKYFYFEARSQLTEDGYFFNTVENMQEDTCLSKYQQTKAIKVLVKEKLINHQNRGIPQKRFFKVNYDEQLLLKIIGIGQKLKNSPIKSKNNEEQKGEKVFGNNTKFNNTKKNNNIYLISQNEDPLFSYYERKYKKHFNEEHPTMNEEKLNELQSNYNRLTYDLDLYDEAWKDIVDYHFANLPDNNNGNILSFLALNGGQGCVWRYVQEIAE